MTPDTPSAAGLSPSPDSGSEELTDLQRLFVEEYLVDLNAGAAYQRAGGSARSASTLGPRLLKDQAVAALIERRMQEREKETRVRVYRVLEVVAFSDPEHYRVDARGNVKLAKGAPRSAMRAISRVKRKVRTIPQGEGKAPIVEAETEYSLWPKGPAIADAMKKLGLFVDRHEVSGPQGGPIEVSTHELRSRIARRVAGIASRIGATADPAGPHTNGARDP
jgi:phage terminase small subunit